MFNSTISMSKKELDRLDVINRSLRKEITVRKAAKLLCLSSRQIYRLRKAVKEQGSSGLVHNSRGRPSNRKMSNEERKKILSLFNKHYPGFGPTLAWEKLTEEHNIERSLSAVRSLMVEEGLWKVKTRKKTEYRSKRARKDCYGEMVQFDGSYHPWFEERAPRCCLLAAIDDATGIVTARFARNESTMAVFSFWMHYLFLRGRPRSIYLDRLRTYTNNGVDEEDRKKMLTQFQRAMKETGVKTISSHSPQARGRVERLFNTLQNRMVKEMRLAGTSSIKEGNAFLKEYLPSFNKKFGVQPREEADLHRKLSADQKKALPGIFSKQSSRVVRNDFTISFQNKCYQLTKKQCVTLRTKDRIVVEERADDSVHLRLKDRYLNYNVLSHPPAQLSENSPWIIPASLKPGQGLTVLKDVFNKEKVEV